MTDDDFARQWNDLEQNRRQHEEDWAQRMQEIEKYRERGSSEEDDMARPGEGGAFPYPPPVGQLDQPIDTSTAPKRDVGELKCKDGDCPSQRTCGRFSVPSIAPGFFKQPLYLDYMRDGKDKCQFYREIK